MLSSFFQISSGTVFYQNDTFVVIGSANGQVSDDPGGSYYLLSVSYAFVNPEIEHPVCHSRIGLLDYAFRVGIQTYHRVFSKRSLIAADAVTYLILFIYGLDDLTGMPMSADGQDVFEA